MCNNNGIYDEALSHSRWKTVLKRNNNNNGYNKYLNVLLIIRLIGSWSSGFHKNFNTFADLRRFIKEKGSSFLCYGEKTNKNI